jgi:hypothetical protein
MNFRDSDTAKVASELGLGSEKSEAPLSVPVGEIYSWATQLACESRELEWVFKWYVRPLAVSQIIHKLETMNGGIIGLSVLRELARVVHCLP